MDDFTRTLDSDSESLVEGQQPRNDDGETVLDPEFSFDYASEEDERSAIVPQNSGCAVKSISLDDIIAKRAESRLLPSHKRKRSDSIDSNTSAVARTEKSEIPNSSNTEGDLTNNDVDSGSDSEEATGSDEEQKAHYFSNDSPPASKVTSFLNMNLSRPLLKALSAMSFDKPTPIQGAAIPVGLLGKDIVGAAVTGSGKTAAFLIPVLERLIHKDKSKRSAATRCLVLVPTRELAVQCFEVGRKLAIHIDVQFCLAVGGLSLKAQEVALRNRPDIVIATPGRLIDHLRNSPNFTLDALDILILDEADRMLEDGFHDELTEIVKSCPGSRQTMLFSATMTDSVHDLVKMSLNNPVRLFVDARNTTAKGLIQEFVRIRSGKERYRSAMLLALCRHTFRHKVIVFVRSKKLAHQLRIAFGILGLKCGELHGNLTQEQRLMALKDFREGTVDFLLATDLASRGLDIKGVETVINYDMPGQLAQYLHRVGRTARAGKRGRSVTLVGEADRKLLKAIIKQNTGTDKVRHRLIEPEVTGGCLKSLNDIMEDVFAVLEEEKEEKAVQRAEMEVRKGQNMIEHKEEIYSRPARTWFQNAKEKEESKKTSQRQYEEKFKSPKAASKSEPELKRSKYAGLSRKTKRRRMTQDEDKGAERVVNAAIRQAKRLLRPGKIGLPETDRNRSEHGLNSKKQSRVKKQMDKGVGFDRDMGERG